MNGVKEVVKIDENTTVSAGIGDIIENSNLCVKDVSNYLLFSVRNKVFLIPELSFNDLNVCGGDTLIFMERGMS